MKIDFQVPPKEKQVGGLEKAIDRLAEALSEGGCDIAVNEVRDGSLVHFHGLWEPSFARLSKRLARDGHTFAVSPHGMLEPWAYGHKRWKKAVYFRLLEGPHLRRSSAIFTTGQLEAENITKRLPNVRVERIPFGAEIPPLSVSREIARATLGVTSEERLLVFLSRLDRKKGLDLLLRALSRSDPKENERLKLFVVGEGPAEEEWRHLAKELAPTLPTVEWRGAKWGDEKWTELLAADLFCLTTHSENFGFAVQEALSVGTPVLTTTETPWAEHAEVSGVHLCRPEVESIRVALAEWANTPKWTPQNREHLAEWTRETFDWARVAKQYCEVYRDLLEL